MFFTAAITAIPMDGVMHCFSEEIMIELVRSVVLVHHRTPLPSPCHRARCLPRS